MPWPWPQLHRVYGVFHGLPEEEAARECRRVLRRARFSMGLDATVLAASVWGGLTIASCIGSAVALDAYKASDRVWYTLASGVLAMSLGVGYLVWAWRYHRLAADTLARRLGPSGDGAWNTCTKCERSLAGLAPTGGRIVCPGCAETYPWLGGAKLSRAACASCGYHLAGLPDVRGLVVCPECGVEAHAAVVEQVGLGS